MRFLITPQLALVLIVFFGGFFGVLACRVGSPYRDAIVERNFAVTSEWKEIATEKVKVVGDNQFLSITFDEPLYAAYGDDGIRIENGPLFNPDILLMDEDGTKYPLPYQGKLGNQRMNYGFKPGLPRNKSFPKILIRSDFPFEAKSIIWTHYYFKDIK